MPYRPRFLAALVAFASAILSAAAAEPAPAAPERGVDGLVAAERAFARMSEEKGVRAAFIAWLGEDAVLFRPRPVPGLPWMRQRPGPSGTLAWRPDFAEVSAAQDLGVTAGPWDYRPATSAKEPPGHGHFVTVWRNRPAEGWKVELDIGVSHPSEPAAPQDVTAVPPRAAGGAPPADIGGSLLAAERDLERATASKNLAEALLDRATDDLRLYREGATPRVGASAARAALASEASPSSWKIEGSGFSASGDLGYVYGVRSAPSAKGEATFFRIWRREPGKPWRVSLDLAVPIPSEPAP